MPTYNDVIDEYVVVCATPFLGLTLVVSEAAVGTSFVAPVETNVIVEEAEVTSTIEGLAFLPNSSTANLTSSAYPSIDIIRVQSDSVHATSAALYTVDVVVIEEAEVTSSAVTSDPSSYLASTANATSTTFNMLEATQAVSSTAMAMSTANNGIHEISISSADVSSTTLLHTIAKKIVQETAEVTGNAFPSSNILELLSSSAELLSSLRAQTVAYTYSVSTAHATSEIWFRNPDSIAWVMNTETTAGSWYDNFDFESLTQANDVVFAVDDSGLYILDGADDDGDDIEGSMKTGLMDFGTQYTKRVDSLYFAYNSNGQVHIDVEVSDHPGQKVTYSLEPRSEIASVNTRVVLGKGLSGRYWRFTIKGESFKIDNHYADIAVSQRRI
jgi:hypothetical protein